MADPNKISNEHSLPENWAIAAKDKDVTYTELGAIMEAVAKNGVVQAVIDQAQVIVDQALQMADDLNRAMAARLAVGDLDGAYSLVKETGKQVALAHMASALVDLIKVELDRETEAAKEKTTVEAVERLRAAMGATPAAPKPTSPADK
jgi:hypothetical protein